MLQYYPVNAMFLKSNAKNKFIFSVIGRVLAEELPKKVTPSKTEEEQRRREIGKNLYLGNAITCYFRDTKMLLDISRYGMPIDLCWS